MSETVRRVKLRLRQCKAQGNLKLKILCVLCRVPDRVRHAINHARLNSGYNIKQCPPKTISALLKIAVHGWAAMCRNGKTE